MDNYIDKKIVIPVKIGLYEKQSLISEIVINSNIQVKDAIKRFHFNNSIFHEFLNLGRKLILIPLKHEIV